MRRQSECTSIRTHCRLWCPPFNMILCLFEDFLGRSNAALFPQDGLLRFARNDVEGHLPTRYSVIARSKATKQSILSFVRRDGLLRSARNDGEGAYPAPSTGRTSSRRQDESE